MPGAVVVISALALGTAAGLAACGCRGAAAGPSSGAVAVLVAETDPASRLAEDAVRSAGGTVTGPLALIDGFAADIPAGAVAALASAPGVAAVWPDAAVTLHDTAEGLEEYDPLPPNGVWRQAVGVSGLPAGTNGAGVTVAVLDTGVTRHPDLGNRVRARVDLTPDGGGYDTYGHGTHMTGLVAGDGGRSAGRWAGAAPGASVVAVRVAEWNGATDVSEVLGALEWIHNNRAAHRIRVLNLSFGTDSTQKHQLDPLNHAVQRLWRAGIVVVAAAGNRGEGGQKIDKPGDDPFVVTVGAADTRGTAATADDVVAPFSSRGPTGENVVKPDLVAPGIGIVSQRAPGSTLDAMRPAARVGADYFKGHGTSQSAAIVSGIVALMVQAAPAMTPDQVKAALVGTADPALAGQSGAGAGLVDAAAAVLAARAGTYASSPANAGVAPSSGTGSIDSTRGGAKPYSDLNRDGKPEQVSGNVDALGNPFDSTAWAARPWGPETASSGPWATVTSVSPGWATTAWTPDAWPGLGWDEPSWTAKYWRDAGLTPENWTAKYWRGEAWN